jgi:pimeloyl-ACP methyl ester carboxylesterase
VLAATSAGWATACGSDDSTSTGADAGTAQEVSFTTEDGVTLSGRLFGAGSSGVILAHMYPTDQTSWYPSAERLAEDGYLVLTFDFRGYGDSEGSKQIALIDKDVTAAIGEITDAGATEVALVGASMGGTASLLAASQNQAPIPITGVAALSAPVEFMGLSAAEAVPKLSVPLLFIAAEEDVGAGGARELQALASSKGGLKLLPGQDHGTDLLEGAHADETWASLLSFIRQVLPAGGGS